MSDLRAIILTSKSMREVKHAAMDIALDITGGNQVKAARLLKISRATLHNYTTRSDNKHGRKGLQS